MISELYSIWESVIRNLEGRLGRWLRYQYYKHRLGSCGTGVRIEMGVILQNPRHIFIGNNVWIDRYTVLLAGSFVPGGRKFFEKELTAYQGKKGELHLASGVHIAPFALLQAHGGLSIGTNVTIASGAKVYTLSHHYRNLEDTTDKKRYHFSSMAPVSSQYLLLSPVVIEEGAAVGLNSVILPGTHVRAGTWVGALVQLAPGVTQSNDVIKSVVSLSKT